MAERPSRVLEICQLGNPVLRKIAMEVTDFNDPSVLDLIADMMHTSISLKAQGLAAPQVGEPRRIFIMSSHPNPLYPDAPHMEPQVMINPRVISASEESEYGWEGCLSIPELRGQVNRHKALFVSYFSPDHRLHEATFEGFPAKVFQHELDHLNGVMFLDRVTHIKGMVTKQELLRMFGVPPQK